MSDEVLETPCCSLDPIKLLVTGGSKEMDTREMPHGILGFNFANALVRGEYEKAYGMLSAEVKLNYSARKLKEEYESMVAGYARPDEPITVEVLDNNSSGNPSADREGWTYVAIYSEGWSEAVTLTGKPFGSEFLITNLVWGRP